MGKTHKETLAPRSLPKDKRKRRQKPRAMKENIAVK